MKFRLSLAIAISIAAPALAHAEPTAAGFWEIDEGGKPTAWFLFSQKNEVYSARFVKGFKKEGDEPPPEPICTKCPGKKKDARVMGLTMFWGMKRDGLNYNDGSVLDPRDGSVYHAKMWLDEDGQTLHLRGYVGVSLFGKTLDLKRLPDDAMKREDIPKEILAGDMDKKPHDASADKPKHKKDKKSDKTDPADAEAPAPTEDKTVQ